MLVGNPIYFYDPLLFILLLIILYALGLVSGLTIGYDYGQTKKRKCPKCKSENVHEPRVKAKGSKYECLSCGETW